MKKNTFILCLIYLFSINFAMAKSETDKALKEYDIEKIIIRIHKQVNQGGYQLMSVAELKRLIDSKDDFVLIDAQPQEHYNRAYIESAKNFEFQGVFTGDWKTDAPGGTQKDFQALLGNDLNKKIILSCGGLQCKRSHTAARWAKQLGYQQVYRVVSGIKGWQEAGYPVKSIK